MARQSRPLSTSLFVADNNNPLHFYIRPCVEKNNLQRIIESGGGILVDTAKEDVIALILPDDPPRHITSFSNSVEVRYVYECVAANKLLPMNDYRVDCSRGPYREYTVEEDHEIIKYIIENELFGYVSTHVLWSRMKSHFVDRNSISLKNRYFNHILPRIESYNLSDNVCEFLYRGCHTYRQPLTSAPSVTTETLQLDKLRNSLVEKLHSTTDNATLKQMAETFSFENSGLVVPIATPHNSDSSNEFIVPDRSGPENSLELMTNSPGQKTSSTTSADVNTTKTEPMSDTEDVSPTNVQVKHSLQLDSLKKLLVKKLNSDTGVVQTEMEDVKNVLPNVENSLPVVEVIENLDSNCGVHVVSHGDGPLHLDSLKKCLVEKLKSSSVNSERTEFEDLSTEPTLSVGAEEFGDETNQSRFVERLQARIRDKMQEEIWVNSLSGVVMTIPAEFRKSILDKVLQKLSLVDVIRSSTIEDPTVSINKENESGMSTDIENPVVERRGCADQEGACIQMQDAEHISNDRRTCAKNHQRDGPTAFVSSDGGLTQKKYGAVFFCNSCTFASKCKVSIESHVILHHGCHTFLCTKCGKSFEHQHDLDDHMRSHAHPVVCSWCGYQTVCKTQLLRHVRKHMTVRHVNLQTSTNRTRTQDAHARCRTSKHPKQTSISKFTKTKLVQSIRNKQKQDSVKLYKRSRVTQKMVENTRTTPQVNFVMDVSSGASSMS